MRWLVIKMLQAKPLDAAVAGKGIYHSHLLSNNALCCWSTIVLATDLIINARIDVLRAIVEHERGHRALHHSLKSIVHLFLPLSMIRRRNLCMELEADAYAAAHGYAIPLREWLAKTARGDFTLQRIAALSRY
jgi:Zn-dependent protease with chaperone function